MGGEIPRAYVQPCAAADARRSDGAALIGGAGNILHRRRQSGLRQFREQREWRRSDAARRVQHSVNLVYVRLLKDILSYYDVQSGVDRRVLADPGRRPAPRNPYLQRFADADGRHFLPPLLQGFSGARPAADPGADGAPRAAITQAAGDRLPVDVPEARLARLPELPCWRICRMPELTNDEIWHWLHPPRHALSPVAQGSRLCRRYPSARTMAGDLSAKSIPARRGTQALEASTDVRQQVYSWLFKGNMLQAGRAHQDPARRAGQLSGRVLDNWRALGYPFGHLVPSLGTRAGCLRRPAGCARRADGHHPQRRCSSCPASRSSRLPLPRYAVRNDAGAQRRSGARHGPRRGGADPAPRMLTGVVDDGTASRLHGAYLTADGSALPVGGKTAPGTTVSTGSRLAAGLSASRAIEPHPRPSIFFLGDRYFGTVTAYVPGPESGAFQLQQRAGGASL